MLKQQSLAVFLILTMLIAPLSNSSGNDDDVQLTEFNVSESNTLNGWPDVPSWRIGDRYTYETQFDVQQLIQQANVSASLNTLTGDTVYEVTDVFFINVNNVQTLATKWKFLALLPLVIVVQPRICYRTIEHRLHRRGYHQGSRHGSHQSEFTLDVKFRPLISVFRTRRSGNFF